MTSSCGCYRSVSPSEAEATLCIVLVIAQCVTAAIRATLWTEGPCTVAGGLCSGARGSQPPASGSPPGAAGSDHTEVCPAGRLLGWSVNLRSGGLPDTRLCHLEQQFFALFGAEVTAASDRQSVPRRSR